MAKSKYQEARFRIINRELKRKSRVKTIHLKKIIEQELDIKVSTKTLQTDIGLLQHDTLLGYEAPIEYDRKDKSWYYTDQNYSIETFGLKEQEVKALTLAAKIFELYKDSGIFANYSNAINKVLDAVKIQKLSSESTEIPSLIQVEKKQSATWSEFLPVIIAALEEKRKIRFTYQKYGSDTLNKRIIAPYLLKEYEGRWYMLGKLENKETITTFALDDRVAKLELLEEFFEREKINFLDYFKYSLGITVPEEAQIEIILSFTPRQGLYIKSIPIHSTQKILADSESGFKVSILVKPTYELYEKILSYGNTVEVVSPTIIREEIKLRLKQTLEKYI